MRLEGKILVTLRATVEGEHGRKRRKFSGALVAKKNAAKFVFVVFVEGAVFLMCFL